MDSGLVEGLEIRVEFLLSANQPLRWRVDWLKYVWTLWRWLARRERGARGVDRQSTSRTWLRRKSWERPQLCGANSKASIQSRYDLQSDQTLTQLACDLQPALGDQTWVEQVNCWKWHQPKVRTFIPQYPRTATWNMIVNTRNINNQGFRSFKNPSMNLVARKSIRRE